jgi:hypothetical protein
MADKLVTVMTFSQSFEAQLAKNLLENEGIASAVSGEYSTDMMGLGFAQGLPHQITLQVREDDAPRAVALLAEVELKKDWEEEAESGADVWICTICGEPISNRLSMCYACQTPRDGIRASAPRDSISKREERITPSNEDEPEA